MDSPEKIKAAKQQVVELMKQRRYDQAIGLLMGLDHPKKTQWIEQVEAKKSEWEFQQALGEPVSPPTAKVKNEPLSTQPVKPKQHGCGYRMARALIIGSLLIGGFTFWIFSMNGFTFSSGSIGGSTIPTQMMNIEPQNVTINDNGTTIGRDFLPVLRRAVADYGYINAYDAQVNADKRLILEIEVTMADRLSNRDRVNDVLAVILRTYATALSPDKQGAIHAGAFYDVNGVPCGENVGMGYNVIASINWANVSDTDIFRNINWGNYGDRGEDYGNLGYGLNPPAAGVCKP